jgi:hypothetical protein
VSLDVWGYISLVAFVQLIFTGLWKHGVFNPVCIIQFPKVFSASGTARRAAGSLWWGMDNSGYIIGGRVGSSSCAIGPATPAS